MYKESAKHVIVLNVIGKTYGTVNILKRLPAHQCQAIDFLPDVSTPVILFTRHSIREIAHGQGLAGYDLQLTREGRDLAFAWGEYLTTQSGRNIHYCISSPIQRCLDTAALMVAGAAQIQPKSTPQIDILAQPLLVEPGSFVVDISQAAPYFRQQGAVGFINSFVKNALPGMKHPINGVLDVLRLLYDSYQHRAINTTQKAQLSLAVSHDTILAAFVAVISGQFQVQPKDWPEMMEGLFVWFEYPETFASSHLHWVWRGQHHQLVIEHLLSAMQ